MHKDWQVYRLQDDTNLREMRIPMDHCQGARAIRLFVEGCKAGRKWNGLVDRDVHNDSHTLASYT